MNFEVFVSKRYMKAKRQQTFISLITLLAMVGVTVGVMALLVVIAVMSGAETDLRNRILAIEPHVLITRFDSPFFNYRSVIQTAEEIEGVITATPFIYSQVMLRSAGGISGAVLKGISHDDYVTDPGRRILQNANRKDATREDQITIPKIVLGKELAKVMKVADGDMITLIAPRNIIGRESRNPLMKRFKVAGAFESGMHEYDKTLAYINLRDAQMLQGGGDSVTGIEIQVKNAEQAKDIAEEINKKTGYAYWSRDWMRTNRNLFLSLKIQKTVMYVILALIVLVAAFNIASMLIMMVMEKTRDIAILKTMGASNGNIRKIFILKGMLIGSIGTILGVSLGFIICMLLKEYKFIDLPGDVYYFSKLPVKLESLDVFIITSVTLLICFLATLYPSHKASKLDPVEGIRYNG
jgi:lipoprotein-releasing system permease protein